MLLTGCGMKTKPIEGIKDYAMEVEEIVIPEDVKKVAPHVLAHRISQGNGKTASTLKFLNKIIENVQVPLESV